LPYFHRITSATTGARKRLSARFAPIRAAAASVPDGYRPTCSSPASGAPWACTVPGARCVAGTRTHIPYTWWKRRSAIRSLATPVFELEFAGLAYRGNGQCGRAVRGGQPKAVRAQRVKADPSRPGLTQN